MNSIKLIGNVGRQSQREASACPIFLARLRRDEGREMSTKATGRKKQVAAKSFMYRKHTSSLFGSSIHTQLLDHK